MENQRVDKSRNYPAIITISGDKTFCNIVRRYYVNTGDTAVPDFSKWDPSVFRQ